MRLSVSHLEHQTKSHAFTVDWSPPTDDVDKSMTKQETQANARAEVEEPHCLTGTPMDADPAAFWQDMCTDIAVDEADYINLMLNPEVRLLI